MLINQVQELVAKKKKKKKIWEVIPTDFSKVYYSYKWTNFGKDENYSMKAHNIEKQCIQNECALQLQAANVLISQAAHGLSLLSENVFLCLAS